jgi:hypothetical protein
VKECQRWPIRALVEAEKKSAQPRGRSWAQEARHAQVPGGKPAPQAMSFG